MNEPTEAEQLKIEDKVHQLMKAFTQTFNLDRTRLRSICLSHIPEHEVEAVLEQVWLEGLRFIRNHGRKMPQKAVDTLTKHRAIDRFRQLEREARLLRELGDNATEALTSEEKDTIIVSRLIIRAVIQHLGKTDAKIFFLCILRGRTATDAGREVKLSPEAVRKRISRTIKPTMKAVARDYGYELSQEE